MSEDWPFINDVFQKGWGQALGEAMVYAILCKWMMQDGGLDNGSIGVTVSMNSPELKWNISWAYN